ncbi:MAG: DUF551 domain-containing protein [Bacteroidales bacterium]|nr:DUF551 domain-containing protein [Bacteroidales bacterium]
MKQKAINKAAKAWVKENIGSESPTAADIEDYGFGVEEIKDAFIAGAEWQSKQSPWISVEDRLPDYDEQVIVHDAEYEEYFTHRSNNPFVQTDKDGWCSFSSRGKITHWMPVPPLPKEK